MSNIDKIEDTITIISKFNKKQLSIIEQISALNNQLQDNTVDMVDTLAEVLPTRGYNVLEKINAVSADAASASDTINRASIEVGDSLNELAESNSLLEKYFYEVYLPKVEQSNSSRRQ